jgi:hypothetical protein
MENMLTPDSNYPFDDIKIKTPKALQGGTYCANLIVNGTPLLIQTPKCKTKNGIHKTAKQIYCDLVLTNDHEEFLDWFDKLQSKVRDLILENSEKWFHESPSLDEIEYNWNDSIRTRKDYCLLRSFVHKTKGLNKSSLQIFDTDENQLGVDGVDNTKNVICILEIIGLKFSSNSFHLEIGLRQLMVINEKPIFDKCLIKLNSNKKNGEKLESVENNLVLENNKEEITNTENDEDIKEQDELTENEVDKAVLDNLVDTDDTQKETSSTNEEVQEIEEVEKVLEKKVVEPEEVDQQEKVEEFVQPQEEEAKSLEKNNDLEEIELDIPEEEPMKLKNPTEVYLDIYRQAREKAKKAKNEAIKAYLEAKRIKELYMLDVVDSSSSDEESEEEEELFSEN